MRDFFEIDGNAENVDSFCQEYNEWLGRYSPLQNQSQGLGFVWLVVWLRVKNRDFHHRRSLDHNRYFAPQPRQQAPCLFCHTRLLLHDLQINALFKDAPHLTQVCIRRPLAAVFWIRAKQIGHAF
jgi:hypothetical protein